MDIGSGCNGCVGTTEEHAGWIVRVGWDGWVYRVVGIRTTGGYRAAYITHDIAV